jgi:hypothetical protein
MREILSGHAGQGMDFGAQGQPCITFLNLTNAKNV